MPGRVVGVDLSERMLERARQVTAAERLDNIRYELGDAQVPVSYTHLTLPTILLV